MRRRCVGVLLLALAAPARAQAPADREPPAPQAGDLRRAMQDYFQTRLRVELGLSDEQLGHIAPRVEELVRTRSDARRQRSQAMAELGEGLRLGASDDELGRLLERAERIDDEQRAREAQILDAIDARLTVRQRAQLRLFVDSFRREMHDKVEALRERRRGPPDGRRGAR